MASNFYIDRISGWTDVRSRKDVIADILQNGDAGAESEAEEIIANDMDEVTDADLHLYGEEQYRQDDYIEIRIKMQGGYDIPMFWVDYHLEGDTLVRGDLHHYGKVSEFWNLPEVTTKLIETADEYAETFPICVACENEKFGDPAFFETGSVEKLASAIEECGYELPEDWLVEGRDYRYVIG